MRDAIAIFAVAFSCGLIFALGQDTWRWLSRRYVKFFHTAEQVVIEVNTEQAIDAIAELQAAIDELNAAASNAKGSA